MIRRAHILAAILAIVGIAVLFRGRANTTPHNEAWVENTYPTSVGDYHMVDRYKMDETTYQELNPMGISSVTMSNGVNKFDVVVISSHERDSFHNPLACFAAQEWTIVDSHQTIVHTASRGDVPFSVSTAKSRAGQTAIAVYTYEGPKAMHAVNSAGFVGLGQVGLHGDMFLSELTTVKPAFATFFRFMSLSQFTKESDLLKFAGQYLDAAPVRPVKV